MTAHPLPLRAAGIAVGPDAVFAIGESGSVMRVCRDGEVTTATPGGPALCLLAADADYVWTVDDAAATVPALDSRSLAPVRRFRRLGAPGAWAGEAGLSGLSWAIPEDDDGAPDAHIPVHVEEYLLAPGYGIGNATRESAGGVTWLRWAGP